MIILVNNGVFADKIYMNKEGKYITLKKPEDPRKEFRYDLSSYEFERITHYKTREDKIEIVDPAKITSWFTRCNLVTDSDKFAKMFIYAAGIKLKYKSPVRYIANFATYQVNRLEKWLSYNIDFKMLNKGLERIQTGSDINYVRRSLSHYIGYDPEDFEKEQIKYLRNVSQKNNGITSDTLHRTQHNWNPQQYKLGKELDELVKDQRYNDAFVITKFNYMGNKKVYNYLEHSEYDRDGRTSVLEVASEWHLDLKAFCNYLLKLQFEAVTVEDLMRNYDDYLKREYEMKNMKRSKMNKYPSNWMSYYHKHHFNYNQMEDLKRLMYREEKIDEYNKFKESKKYLEYKKDAYFIRLPENIEDIANEATQLNHCLYERYTDKILDGETIILFMRQVDHPDDSVLTVEIKYDGIQQAKGYNNRDPTPEEKAWLLNWAGKKGLDKVIRQQYY